MKSFQRLCKVYQLTGTYPSQLNQHHSINVRILIILLILTSYFSVTFSFFLFDTPDAMELANIFFQSISAIAYTVNFLVHFWKTPAVLDLIEKFDEFIAMSKCRERLDLKNKTNTLIIFISIQGQKKLLLKPCTVKCMDTSNWCRWYWKCS